MQLKEMDHVPGKHVLGSLLPMKLPDLEGDDCVLGTHSLTYRSTRDLLKTLLVKNVNLH